MTDTLPYRSTQAGEQLEVLVLASGGGELIGIDLASGAFVRAPEHQGHHAELGAYDVVVAQLAEKERDEEPYVPESVELAAAPRRAVRRLKTKRIERLLGPFLDPPGPELFGFAGPSIPFWMLDGHHPSLALLTLATEPTVVLEQGGHWCRFSWHGRPQKMPLLDARLLAALEASHGPGDAEHNVAKLVKFRVHLALVALSAPFQGNCYKVVAALLPQP